VRLLQPHIQDILELVKAALLDENHSDPVYGLAYGIIGDLAEIFGAQIKPLLLQDWVAAELKSRRCPPENKQTMRWAREVGQFEIIPVPLNDIYSPADGQTCHCVSIILLHFLLLRAKAFLFLLTILTLLVQCSRSRNSSCLGFAIPFPCPLFVDGHLSGGVSSSIILLRLGSALLLTSSVHFLLLFFFFWFESLLSIIAVSLNSNPPPPLHCYIIQSFSPRQAVTVNGSFAYMHHHPPAYHTMPFLTGLPISSPVLEPISAFNISISLLLSVSLVLPSHPISLSSLCSSVPDRLNFIEISST